MRVRYRTGVSRAGVLFGLGIVILFGSLAPIWVLNQRNEQRSLTCKFNQSRIAEAFHRYDEEVGMLPGYCDYRFGRPVEGADSSETELTSWVFPLLPHLYGREDPGETDPKPAWHSIYELYGPLAEGENRRVPLAGRIGIFLCPDDPNRDGPAPLTMVVNAGQPDRDVEPADFRENGLLLSAAGPTQSWSLRQVMEADGISHTILLTENVDAGDWNESIEARLSILWRPLQTSQASQASEKDSPLFINERRGEFGEGDQAILFARPSAYHRWGVNVTFADGSNRVLTPQLDRRTYLQLLVPDDANCRDNISGKKLGAEFKQAN